MKAWQRHPDHLRSGDWHVHANFTDGEATVDEVCASAQALGIPLITFTEHVRKNLTYDFAEYLDQIAQARRRYDLTILSGCEAKLLPGGELDAPEDVLAAVDCPVFSIHGKVRDKADLIERVSRAIEHPLVNSWGHPGAGTVGTDLELDEDEVVALLTSMKAHDVALELNDKYDAPAPHWVTVAQQIGVTLVRGSDTHRLPALEASFRKHLASSAQ